MRNMKYFPFERNKYFFGKLLGVADFEAEQKYFNNKRRLINRLVNGVGIICGLNVVKVDDSFISVESGLALDFVGREILVDSPVVKKLSMFEGFEEDKDPNDSRYVYLCLEYNEEEKEPIHSIANTINNGVNQTQYNKYKEGYRLFLDYNKPEIYPSEIINIQNNIYTVYEDSRLSIEHILPKCVRFGEEFELIVRIEKNSLSTEFSFDYELALECLEYNNSDTLNVSFNEKDFSKDDEYKIKYTLKAKQVSDIEGAIRLNINNFNLNIGKINVKIDSDKVETLKITKEDPKEVILKNYFTTNMDEITNLSSERKIYLAKISLIKAANTYIIEKIENNPFNQYVLNSTLVQALLNIEGNDIEKLKNKGEHIDRRNMFTQNVNNEQAYKKNLDIASGVEKMELLEKRKAGDIVYSDEIMHGLGLGNVYVTLGIENKDEDITFGESSIFGNNKIEIASKVNTKKGTMIIGIKLLENISEDSISIRWMAYRDIKESVKDIEQITLSIKPNISDINVRDSIYFEAVSTGLRDKRCEWSIKENEGGYIDENGKYMAPNVPGIYEIVAKSISNPEVSSSTFVVVRENLVK